MSDYIFDLDRFSSFEGKTGPYLQYQAVRIKSILRKAAEQGFKTGPMIPPEVEVERSLLLELLQFGAFTERSIEARSTTPPRRVRLPSGPLASPASMTSAISSPSPIQRDSHPGSG